MLDAKTEQPIEYQANTEQVCQAISDCLNIEALTPFILNKLIEKDQIAQVETINGQTEQEIIIIWRWAGLV